MRTILTSVLAILLSISQVPESDDLSTAQQIVVDLSARHFAAVTQHFNDTMRTALPTDKLEMAWDTLVAQAGRFKGIVGVRLSDQMRNVPQVIVTCTFASTNIDAKIAFDNNGKIAGLYFLPSQNTKENWSAPPYVLANRIREERVTIQSANWRLPGILSLPKEKGTFPAIVLVHGSGPHDSDETLGPNKPFKDLAWGLASSGIAVLRYDKRTFVYGAQLAGENPQYTVRDEVIDDAIAAVNALSAKPEIDSKQVYLLGHSLGGTVAPRIAAADTQIAGIIMLAAPSRSMGESLVEQASYFAKLAPADKDAQLELRRAEAIKREIDDPTLTAGSTIDVFGSKTPGSYWLDLRGYKPVDCARQRLSQFSFCRAIAIIKLLKRTSRAGGPAWLDLSTFRPNRIPT